MKPILIQGAMDVEVAYLIDELSAVLDNTIGSFEFYKGFYLGCPVVISKTKIGMSNSSSATTIGILTYSPSVIINQGIAGAHSRKLHVGDVVLGQSVVNICSFEKSALISGVDYKLWQHTNFSEHDASSDAKLLGDAKLIEIFSNSPLNENKIHIGTIGSGDVWNKEIEFIDFLNSSLKTLCEDMETIGVYNVATRFSTPVLGVRTISNNEITGELYDTSCAKNTQVFVISCLDKIIDFYSKNTD